METNTKTRWQIRFAVLAIFVIGFLAGALAMNAYRARRAGMSPGERGGYARVFDQLNLTAEQRSQVDQIFSEARARLTDIRKDAGPKFREVRQQTDDRLKAVLTPEQWEQFQQLTSDARHRRARHGRENKNEP